MGDLWIFGLILGAGLLSIGFLVGVAVAVNKKRKE